MNLFALLQVATWVAIIVAYGFVFNDIRKHKKQVDRLVSEKSAQEIIIATLKDKNNELGTKIGTLEKELEEANGNTFVKYADEWKNLFAYDGRKQG